eukprot:UN27205
MATVQEDVNKLWKTRHNAFWASKSQAPPGTESLVTDVAVPVDCLSDCINQAKAEIDGNHSALPEKKKLFNFPLLLLVQNFERLKLSCPEKIKQSYSCFLQFSNILEWDICQTH